MLSTARPPFNEESMPPKTKTAFSAGKLSQSSQAVYDLIRKSKRSTHAVHLLQPEIKKTSDICRLIERTIKLLPDSHQDLPKAVDEQLFRCLESIQTVKKTLDLLPGLPSIFRQTFRNSKVDVNEDLLDRHRTQLQQSIVNLEFCLHLIEIQITYLAAQIVDKTLITRLDTVQYTIDSRRDVVDENIRLCAKRYLSDGTILYARNSLKGSDAGLSNNSTPNASVIRKQSLKTIRSIISKTGTETETETGSIADSATISSLEHRTSVADTLVPSRIQDEFDDSQNVEPDYHLLAVGKEAMLENEYKKAEAALSRCLRSIEMLTKQRKNAQSLDEIRLLLAVCAFHLDSPVVAQATLVSAISGAYFSSDNVEIRCEAFQCLTIVYARLCNLDQTTLTCEALLRQSIRFFGKDDKVYRVLAVLTRIYKVRQDTERINAYRSIIPVERRAQLLKESEQILPEMIKSMFTPSKSSDKDSSYSKTPRSSISKPTRSMQFHEQKTHGDNCILAIAWSHDNYLIAIGFCVSDRRIELRNTVTEEVVHTLNIGGVAGIHSMTFDRSARKLVAAFNKDQGHEETDSYLRIWNVETGQEIWNVTVLSGRPHPWIHLLSFNPFNEDQLLVNYSHGSCRDLGFFIYNTVSKRTVVHRTLITVVEGVIWTKDMVVLSERSMYIAFNTVDYQQITKDSVCPGPWIRCSGLSPSGQLLSMSYDGSIYSCVKDVWTPLPFLKPSVPLAGVKDSFLGFNNQGIMVILILTYTGYLYLRAPALQKWVTVARGLSTSTIVGLSPDARYAYFTAEQNNKIWFIHIFNIQDCLRLPSLPSKDDCIFLNDKN